MSERRRITIELTPQDEARVKLIQEDTGDPTIVGAIRWALRYLANDLNQTISPDKVANENRH